MSSARALQAIKAASCAAAQCITPCYTHQLTASWRNHALERSYATATYAVDSHTAVYHSSGQKDMPFAGRMQPRSYCSETRYTRLTSTSAILVCTYMIVPAIGPASLLAGAGSLLIPGRACSTHRPKIGVTVPTECTNVRCSNGRCRSECSSDRDGVIPSSANALQMPLRA